MDVAHGELQRDQFLFAQDVFRKGFFDLREASIERGGLKAVHNLAGYASVLEFLSAGIYSGEGAYAGVDLARRRGIVYLRVDDIHAAAESLRLAEENEYASRRKPLPVPLDALEEHHLHLAGTVRNDHAQAFDGIETQGLGSGLVLRAIVYLGTGLAALYEYRTAGAIKRGPYYSGHDLDMSDVRSDFGYPLDAAPVDIPERIQMDEIAESGDLQLCLQQLGPFRPHARQILYVRF